MSAPGRTLPTALFRFLKRGAQAGLEDETRSALLRILELNKEMAHTVRPETLPDRILDAAETTFYAHGIDQATMEEVAHRHAHGPGGHQH